MFNKVVLKKGKDAAVFRKHPWVFSGALREDSLINLENGEKIELVNSASEFVAFGHYEKSASIAIRILSFAPVLDFSALIIEKLSNALELRKELISTDTNSFRLVHGEGDGLPGLIIDIYAQSAVIQCHSTGMFKDIEKIANALDDVYSGKLVNIYCKSSDTLGVTNPDNNYFLKGSDHFTLVIENGIKYEVNWVSGQKTGLFLDQRENRKLLGQFSKDKMVLDLFSNTGGFTLNAIKGKAKGVVSVDVSSKATVLVENNIKINDFEESGNFEILTMDCLKYLQETEHEFDIVIVDPPAFAKSLSKKHNAVQGYKRLNKMALSKVKSGGLLFTFSCSQVVDEMLFYNTIVAACIESNRNVQVLYKLTQGPDHPVNIFHREGSYLKGLVLKIS
jgi:23S rRNA (cytosine1962-C5)-methyltransferase